MDDQDCFNIIQRARDEVCCRGYARLCIYGRPEVGTVAQTAKRYADFIDRVWPKVVEVRLSSIEIVRYEANKRVIPSTHDVYWENWAKIVDHTSGFEGYNRQVGNDDKHGKNPRMDELRSEMVGYKSRVEQDLRAQFSEPASIAHDWRTLVATPIKVG